MIPQNRILEKSGIQTYGPVLRISFAAVWHIDYVAFPMIPTFLFTLAGGMLLMLATGTFSEIAGKFLRFCGYLALALATVGTTLVFLHDDPADDSARSMIVASGACAATAAAVLAMLAPLAARLPMLSRGACILGGIAAVGASICMVGPRNVFHCVNQVSSALFLGAITVAWLLGHAYLTATKMTIAPLRHFSRMLTWAVLIRIVFVAVSLIWAGSTQPAPGVLSQVANNWLVALLRCGLGLIAVGIFAYMVSDCVRRRSTQSATGILYFGSLFAYIGELAAQHLTREIGWPM